MRDDGLWWIVGREIQTAKNADARSSVRVPVKGFAKAAHAAMRHGVKRIRVSGGRR